MKLHVNIRFVITLVITSLVFYAVGVNHTKEVNQKNSAFEYVKATTESFQVNEARYLAFQLLTSKQFECLDYVLTRESHWNSKAKNPNSSAKGIGQLLNDTYRNIGMRHSTDSRAQLIATLAYIGRWYGSAGPCGAKAHWLKHKWY
jgi:membrane-bound lytic murein transglycosylase MltF